MYIKNTAGQHIPFVLVNASTGTAMTGATVTAKMSLDGAAQATPAGAVTEKAGGQYDFAPAQADTNAETAGYLFTATGAIPVHMAVSFLAANVPADVKAVSAAVGSVEKNAALPNFLFPMFDSTGALKTGLTVTVAIRLDNAAFHNTAATPTEIGNGWYTVDLGTADTNGNVIAFSATAVGAAPTCITILTQA